MIADNNYLPFFKVTVTSLVDHMTQSVKVYCILSEKVDKSFYEFMENLRNYNHKFEFQIIDCSLKKINYSPKNHVSRTAYLKVELPSILSFLDTVVYLDSDLLIREDINNLWKLSDSSLFVQAVWNPGYNYDNFTFNRDLTYETFNSGVMIMNLKKMRDNYSEDKLKLFLNEKNSITKLNDQAAFNAVFQEWGRLPETWNTQYCFFYKKNNKTTSDYKKKWNLLSDPKILHFTSNSKPWLFRNCHPFKKEYMKILKTVEIDYSYPDVTFKSIIRKIIECKQIYFW